MIELIEKEQRRWEQVHGLRFPVYGANPCQARVPGVPRVTSKFLPVFRDGVEDNLFLDVVARGS
jgi:hypothetical protein